MAIHKLADGPITLVVTAADKVASKFSPGTFQYQVDGADADGQEVRLFVSETAFTQQLARIKLSPEAVEGETLHFEQIKKDGKTFTNITRAVAGSPTVAGVQAERAQTAAAAKPAPAPIARMTVAEAAELYGQCVDAAIAKFWAPLTAENVAVSAEAIQSAAATIFIAVKGR